MAQTGPGLPGLGQHGGRMRNTLANLQSKNVTDYGKGAEALPALSPAQNANYYAQLGNLYANYQNQLAGLKQQRVGLRANFRVQREAIRGEKIGGLQEAENAAAERGILGSSADLQTRIGVRGQAAAAREAARGEMLQGVAQTRIAGQQAAIEYAQGARQLESQKLAQQQEMLAQQLQNNMIMSGMESQMDAMKQIYRALMNNMFSDNDRRGRRRRPNDPRFGPSGGAGEGFYGPGGVPGGFYG